MTDLQRQINVLGDGQKLLHDQMAEVVTAQAELPQRIEEAIERGFERAVDKLIDKAQQRAAEHTGRWLLGTVKGLIVKGAFVVFVFVGLAKIVGVPLAMQIWEGIFKK